jgi:toxin ParE1/3/4
MKLVWHPQAQKDMEDIYRYVARDNAKAAGKLRDRIVESIGKLCVLPNMGRPERCDNTRELSIPGTRYIVPYMVVKKSIRILRVYHSARLWPEKIKT